MVAKLGVFDIIGPVMIGPSSSHTAGAVRIGRLARAISRGTPRKAKIWLHGSFARTFRGHGTDLALVAGLLGLDTGDERIKTAFDLAREEGLEFAIEPADLGDVHPNTARLSVGTVEGVTTVVTGSSIGGGNVVVTEVDGFPVDLTGEYHTLVILHHDEPGVVSKVTTILALDEVNIARMNTSRQRKGADALMVIEVDQPGSPGVLPAITKLPQVKSAIMIEPISL